MTTTPLVDIIMPTYNHERFVVQAIESVLAQKTDFEYRLNIADDCSSDGTQAIIKDYTLKHGDLIRSVISPRNIGILHQDRVSIKVLRLCTARYVALLEGDDYWTDPYKLQKQVDFLESHPDFAICFHNVIAFYEDGSRQPANMMPPDYREVSTIEHLFSVNFIPACSTVFRRGLFPEFPDWYYTLRLGDWAMHIMNAQYGKIRYLNEVMAAYRVHPAGLWTATSPTSQRLEIIRMLDHVDAYLGYKYRKQVRAAKAVLHNELAQLCYSEGDRAQGRRYLRKYFWLCDSRSRRNLLALFLRLKAPRLYHHLRSIRNFVRPSAPYPSIKERDGTG